MLSVKQQEADLNLYRMAVSTLGGETPPLFLDNDGLRHYVPTAATPIESGLFVAGMKILTPVLMRRRAEGFSEHENASMGDWRVRDVLRAVQESSGNSALGLSTIGEGMRISAGHLGALFSRHTGFSFRRYQRAVRARRAAELLGEYSASVSAAARLVGYHDASNFVRDFKAVSGISPGRYRAYLDCVRRPA